MRKLALVPLFALALACIDSTVLQPDKSLTVAASRAGTQQFTFQLTFDQQWVVPEQWLTPSGVLHMDGYDNGFFIAGDLVGYNHTVGKATINLNNGKGTASAIVYVQLTVPADGTFECRMHSTLLDFPAALVQFGKLYECEGAGAFAGKKMKGTFTNENNPGGYVYEAFAEMY